MTTKSIQQFSNLLPRSEHRSQTAKTLDNHPIQRDTRSRRQPHQRRHCIAPRSQHTVERGTQTTRRPGLGRFSTLIDWPQGVSHTTFAGGTHPSRTQSPPQFLGEFATRGVGIARQAPSKLPRSSASTGLAAGQLNQPAATVAEPTSASGSSTPTPDDVTDLSREGSTNGAAHHQHAGPHPPHYREMRSAVPRFASDDKLWTIHRLGSE